MNQVRDRLAHVLTELHAALDLVRTDDSVDTRAERLMVLPGLAPSDVFHAAHAIEAFCEAIVSGDSGFDLVPGLRRIGPP